MGLKKSLIEITHDEGYVDLLLTHINNAFRGKDMRADKIVDLDENCVAINKDTKSKRYRPCENTAEAERFWNEVLKPKSPPGRQEDSRYRIISTTSTGVYVGVLYYSYKQAFETFECADGTPFGVEE